MKIHDIIGISLDTKQLISFVGAGGKTTTLFKLTNELRNEGKKILVTTTTAIYLPEKEKYDEIIIDNSKNIIEKLINIKNKPIVLIGSKISSENKVLGVKSEFLDIINKKKVFDYILVEADGSKEKPIKCPSEYEPVVPNSTSLIVGIIGLDAIGKRVNNMNVHRVDLFEKVIGCKENDILSIDHIIELIKNKNGLFGNCHDNIGKIVLLNKFDVLNKEKQVELSNKIKNVNLHFKILFTSILKNKVYNL